VLSIIVAHYFVQGLRAWFLFINSVVFAFILPLSWLRFFWWRLNIYGEAAALVVGLPLSYIVWFPQGFSDERNHAFWEGFLLLFGLGAATSIIVSLATRPESTGTLREFHRRCRPPGLWGPVVDELSNQERLAIRRETAADLFDCVLGVAFAAASIVAVVSALGRQWPVFGGSSILLAVSGGLFMRRWAQRGVFRELQVKPLLQREET
jgi:Na+/proline symporter